MKKTISIIRWFFVMIILLLAFVLAKFLYPIAYLFRNVGFMRNKVLWIFFDDEDGCYGAEYWKKAKGITKDNFWTSYRWLALRNPMWNLHTLMKPIEGDEVVVHEKGLLTQNGVKIDLDNVAKLHYEDELGNWVGNSGDKVSIRYSVIGKTFIWFSIKSKLYWRCSLVKKYLNYFWVELQLGTGNRYTFRLKIKKQ